MKTDVQYAFTVTNFIHIADVIRIIATDVFTTAVDFQWHSSRQFDTV